MSTLSSVALSLGAASLSATAMSSSCTGVRGLIAGCLACISLVCSNVCTTNLPLSMGLNLVCMAILSFGIMRNYSAKRAALIIGIGGPLIMFPAMAYCFGATQFSWTDPRIWSVLIGITIAVTGLRST